MRPRELNPQLQVCVVVLATITMAACATDAQAPYPDALEQEDPAPTMVVAPTAQEVAPAATPLPASTQEAAPAAATSPTQEPAKSTLTVTTLPEAAPSNTVALSGTLDRPEGQFSLEARIASSDVIIRGTVTSVSAVIDGYSVIGVDMQPKTARFAHGLAYTFKVAEYLKGNGGTTVVGVALDMDKTYETKALADAETVTHLADRDTQWEDREAIVFLNDYSPGRAESTSAADRFQIGPIRVSGLDDWYTINSQWLKLWLPSTTAPVSGSSDDSVTTSSTFMLDAPGQTTMGGGRTDSTITLTNLKSEIATIAAEVAAGDGTAAYAMCVTQKYGNISFYENRLEHDKAFRPDAMGPRTFQIASGLPKGTSVNPAWDVIFSLSTSASLEGEHAHLFEVGTDVVKTLRPLPGGEYTWVHLDPDPETALCNAPITAAEKEYSDYLIQVIPDDLALLEAFFDPVNVGTTVAADSANGVLKPDSFTDANGASATIESISYEPAVGSGQDGTVKLEVDPHTGVANHVVDFIELDGSVSLSLKVSDATVDSPNDTLSWSVSSQPWEDGDMLMVRIREGLPYAPAPQGLSVSLADDTFTISWSAVTDADQYRVGYRAGGSEGEWTDLDATTGTSQTFSPEGGPSCGTTYDFRVQARGDGTTYLAGWSAPSEPASHTTGPCNRAPVFGSSSYSFSVAENAPVWHGVGTVSATDPDEGDSITYHITAGNGGGRFDISSGDHGGLILVWGALDYETVSSYTLTVEARDGKAGGTSSATVEISVTNVAEGTPSAPDGLSVSLSGDTFTISWSAVTGAGQYRAQHRTGGSAGTWTSLDATTGTSRTFSPDGGPSCGTTYDFRVQAQGDGETHVVAWGAASEPVSHTTGACNRAPAFGSATYSFTVSEDAATGTAVGTVSATDPDEGDSVAYSITAGNGDAKFSIGGSDGSITVAGSLDYETTLSYTLTVQAIDGDSGAATATVKISVTDVSEAAPPPPTNMTSSYNSAAGSFGFTWHAVAGADVYRVQYRTGGDEGNWTNLDATTSTSHTFRPAGGPLCGTTYKFQIQARGDGETYPANWSSGSGSVTYNTPTCNVAESPPPAPQDLAATATHNSVTLSWTAPDDSTVTGYQVLRRRPAHGETKLLVHVSDTGSTATTYTDSALQASTRYVYRVKAINAAGVGPFSNRVTATTPSRP